MVNQSTAEAVGGGGHMTRAPRFAHRRAWLFVLAAGLLLSLTGISFLASGDSVGLSIAPLAAPTVPGSTLSAGQSVEVTSVQGANLSITAGAGHTDSGLLLYQIQVNPTLSDAVYATLDWVDPADANGALKNGYMDVGLYYETGADTSGCASGEYAITGIDELGDGTSKLICVAPAADQSQPMGLAVLTKATASATLVSTTANRAYLYVLASIYSNGGNLPPGQQSNLGTLQFYLNAQVHQ